MIVLAFDTATPDTVVGLTGAGEPVELRHTPAADERPGHAEQVLPLCREALERAGVGWPEVARIGVGVGPGTFTGLRIGVATGRALAQSAGADVVGVSTLRALAAGPRRPVPAVIDARRGEAFAASSMGRRVPCGRRISVRWQAAGRRSATARYDFDATDLGDVPPEGSPLHNLHGAVVCRLAEEAEPIARDALLPDYVRDPDAKPRP